MHVCDPTIAAALGGEYIVVPSPSHKSFICYGIDTEATVFCLPPELQNIEWRLLKGTCHGTRTVLGISVDKGSYLLSFPDAPAATAEAQTRQQSAVVSARRLLTKGEVVDAAWHPWCSSTVVVLCDDGTAQYFSDQSTSAEPTTVIELFKPSHSSNTYGMFDDDEPSACVAFDIGFDANAPLDDVMYLARADNTIDKLTRHASTRQTELRTVCSMNHNGIVRKLMFVGGDKRHLVAQMFDGMVVALELKRNTDGHDLVCNRTVLRKGEEGAIFVVKEHQLRSGIILSDGQRIWAVDMSSGNAKCLYKRHGKRSLNFAVQPVLYARQVVVVDDGIVKRLSLAEQSLTSDWNSASEETAKLTKMLAIDEKQSSEVPQPSKCEMPFIDVENMSEKELADAMSAACSSLANVVTNMQPCAPQSTHNAQKSAEQAITTCQRLNARLIAILECEERLAEEYRVISERTAAVMKTSITHLNRRWKRTGLSAAEEGLHTELLAVKDCLAGVKATAYEMQARVVAMQRKQMHEILQRPMLSNEVADLKIVKRMQKMQLKVDKLQSALSDAKTPPLSDEDDI